MLTDAQLANRLETMLAGIEVPAPPVGRLLAHASQRQVRLPSHAWTAARIAVAAAIIVGAVLSATPIVAPGIVQTVEARLARLLQWTPPPVAPRSVDSAMVSRAVSLREAQALVRFPIVRPAGLPHDAAFVKLVATPTAIYSKPTHSWSIGASSLTFWYRRTHGREFGLLADIFDPRTGAPPKYIFNADEIGPNGLPKRHMNFAWRNGNQEMSIVQDANIGAAEIEAIRIAMHGIVLHPSATHAELNSGSIVKEYRVSP
jgi:hypothetical protein